MTNSNQKERFQTKIAMLEQNNQVLRNKCEEYLGELIRTRRALDVARNGLEYIFGYEGVPKYVVKHIRQVLDQIKNETTLKQKDVK